MIINERSARSSSSWYRRLLLEDTIPEKDIIQLPYCIYEVKIANHNNFDQTKKPNFVTELEECNAIIEAKKFSKYLSGASIFHTDKVQTLPWWASDTNFIPLYNNKNYNSNATADSCSNTSNETTSSIMEPPTTTNAAVILSDGNELIPNTSNTSDNISIRSLLPIESNSNNEKNTISNNNNTSSSFIEEVIKNIPPLPTNDNDESTIKSQTKRN